MTRMAPPAFLALCHAAFAAFATAVNVATRYVSSTLYTGRYELYAAMAAGTLAGLIAKYVLALRFVFRERAA